jgi:hypothetical protein
MRTSPYNRLGRVAKLELTTRDMHDRCNLASDRCPQCETVVQRTQLAAHLRTRCLGVSVLAGPDDGDG